MIWNTRDFTASPFMEELEDMVNSFYGPDVPRQQSGKWKDAFEVGHPPLFTAIQERKFPVVHTATIDMVLEYIMSLSVIAELSHRKKTDARLSIARLIETNADVRIENGKKLVTLQQVVELYWCEKLH